MRPLCGLLLAASVTLHAQLPTAYTIRTVAGTANIGDGGPANQAVLEFPTGMAADAAGNIYVSEIDAGRIRRMGRDGSNITTFAGRGVRVSDGDGGPATQAGFVTPAGMAFDGAGNFFVADLLGCRIRRVTPAGVISTHAGNGTCASSANGTVAATSPINGPASIAFDPQGRLVFTELFGHRIRRIEANGTLSTLAGTGVQAFADAEDTDGGMAAQSPISEPAALFVTANGTVYFSQVDYNCHIRSVSPAGILGTVVGEDGDCELEGPGPARTTRMGQAFSILVVGNTLYYSDIDHNVVMQVDLAATPPRLDFFVGTTGNNALAFGGDGGPPGTARLAIPVGLLRDQGGAIYVCDQFNHRIRRVQGQVVSTFAGQRHFAGDGGPALAARLFRPAGVDVDFADGFYIADQFHNRIRRVNAAGVVSTAAGSDDYPDQTGNGGLATAARLHLPQSIVADPNGNYYIAEGQTRDTIHDYSDQFSRSGGLRRVNPAGTISALDIAGQAGLALDVAAQMLYYSAPFVHQVRRQSVNGGVAAVVAGAANGLSGFSGDNGLATAARLNSPSGNAFDNSRNLYTCDTRNHRVRRTDAVTGIITTVVGDGTAGITGEGGPGTQARLDSPRALAWDPGGRLWISDRTRLLIYTPADGRLVRMAGRDVPGDGGDGGPALLAGLNEPSALRWSGGRIYVADQRNNRIRLLEPLTAARVELTGGSTQNGTVGIALTLSTKVVSSDNLGVAGVTVRFTVTAGSGNLSSPTATTGADGVASVTITPTAPGAITVSVVAGTLTAVVYNITVTAAGPAITITSVIAAGAFGGGATLCSGGWLEIYGSNFSDTTREWGGADFNGVNAPTELDGVRVLMGGRRAAVRFISGGQINAQAPDGLAPGPVQVIVQRGSSQSAPFTVTIVARAPGLLAPPVFRVGGRQYIAALFTDNVTFAAPDEIAPGLTRRANSGDRLILYGINFGATVPAVPSGTITGVVNALPNVVIKVDGRDVVVEFAGLAGSAIGLYQFNIVLPGGLSGDVRLTVTVDGVELAQELFLALAP